MWILVRDVQKMEGLVRGDHGRSGKGAGEVEPGTRR